MLKILQYVDESYENIKVYWSDEDEAIVIINWTRQRTHIIDDYKNFMYLLCKYMNNSIDEIVYMHEDEIKPILSEIEEFEEIDEIEKFPKLKKMILEYCEDNCINIE